MKSEKKQSAFKGKRKNSNFFASNHREKFIKNTATTSLTVIQYKPQRETFSVHLH